MPTCIERYLRETFAGPEPEKVSLVAAETMSNSATHSRASSVDAAQTRMPTAEVEKDLLGLRAQIHG